MNYSGYKRYGYVPKIFNAASKSCYGQNTREFKKQVKSVKYNKDMGLIDYIKNKLFGDKTKEKNTEPTSLDDYIEMFFKDWGIIPIRHQAPCDFHHIRYRFHTEIHGNFFYVELERGFTDELIVRVEFPICFDEGIRSAVSFELNRMKKEFAAVMPEIWLRYDVRNHIIAESHIPFINFSAKTENDIFAAIINTINVFNGENFYRLAAAIYGYKSYSEAKNSIRRGSCKEIPECIRHFVNYNGNIIPLSPVSGYSYLWYVTPSISGLRYLGRLLVYVQCIIEAKGDDEMQSMMRDEMQNIELKQKILSIIQKAYNIADEEERDMIKRMMSDRKILRLLEPYYFDDVKPNIVSSRNLGQLFAYAQGIIEAKAHDEMQNIMNIDLQSIIIEHHIGHIIQETYNIADDEERDLIRKLYFLRAFNKEGKNGIENTDNFLLGIAEAKDIILQNKWNLLYYDSKRNKEYPSLSDEERLYKRLTGEKYKRMPYKQENLGEGMGLINQLVRGYWKPRYLVDLYSKTAVEFMNLSEVLLTVTDEDIDWESMKNLPQAIIAMAKNHTFHLPGYIHKYKDGIAEVEWFLIPPFNCYDGVDGVRLEGAIDRSGKVIKKFTRARWWF